MRTKRSGSLLTPAPPAPTRRDSESIVDAILQAAVALAPEASMTAIAEKAGVGVASVYRYFPNQGAIYAELTRRLQREFIDTLLALTSQEGLTLDQGIQAMCRIAIALPGPLRRAIDISVPFAWSESHAVDAYTKGVDLITAWIQNRMSSPPADLRTRVFLMFASIRGMSIFSTMMPEFAPTDEDLVAYMHRHAMALLTA